MTNRSEFGPLRFCTLLCISCVATSVFITNACHTKAGHTPANPRFYYHFTGKGLHRHAAAAELLGQLLERACQGLQRLRQFDEDPDIADDTFLLASRVLSYTPKLLLNNARLLAALLDSAQAGILVQHRYVNTPPSF